MLRRLHADDFKPASIDLSNAILQHNADGSVVIKVPDGDVGNPLSLNKLIDRNNDWTDWYKFCGVRHKATNKTKPLHRAWET